MNILKDKIVLVTGGASGIGFEIANLFCEQGAFVYIGDINLEAAEAAAHIINSAGDCSAKAVQVDISNEEDVKKACSVICEEKQRIDILVNNASIHRAYPIVDFPVDIWEEVFRINMTGTFICSKTVARIMQEQRSGVIITISACSSRKADAQHAAYSSAKAAQVEFNRVLALELGPYGIRSNCILPGATETEMLKGVFRDVPGLKESIVEKTILGKLATPRDQANAALFLASDLASHITGEYLVVAGGEFLNP